MPHRPPSVENLAFEIEWSFAREVDERVMLSSADRYRRAVLSGGGMVQHCDVDAGARSGPGRVVRMTVRCDRAAIAQIQSEMLADDAIALHLVRRVSAVAHSVTAAGLGGAGFAPPAVDALNALIERRVAEQIRAQPALAWTVGAAGRMLSARDVGIRLGNLSDQTVRIREKEGKLFSLLRPNRQRGREYPEYQLEPGIHGRPLNAVLRAFGDVGGEVVHAFLTKPLASLGELSPLEVLRGDAFVGRPADPLLMQSAESRLAAVLSAAQEHLRTLA